MDGPYVVVEQRVRNAERVSCPACIGIASRQRNRLDGFCELWGSKSQCDRAEPIRRRTLSRFDGELRSLGALGDGESIFGRQPGNGPSSPDGDDGVSDS